jgi:ribose 5-phosphate isomerase A
MTQADSYKEAAARRAVDFVESGMVLGLGTGSTAQYALEEIGRRIRQGGLKDVKGIPSSRRTSDAAVRLGIPLTTLDANPRIDLTIDGADEVDPGLNLIKGGGGALLWEKVIAEASDREIIVVDESKLSPMLGTHWAVPVEVIPFAVGSVTGYIGSLGGEVTLRKAAGDAIFETDQGNRILDCGFGPIPNPGKLAERLKARAGIVEHGLFIGLATDLIVAGPGGTRHLRRE